jgi:tRNA A37 N6-isopentenylltransferase MiaA
MTNVFFIVGPTASGKSEIAADVARAIDAEIVNADAFQIYQGFAILSAKPDKETLAKARHHLIGTMSILQEMNAEKFRRAALRAIEEIRWRGKRALVVGGSGLYIKALTHGLTSDWKKAEVDCEGVFIFRDREELYARINKRVEAMIERGAIDEVRNTKQMSATASKMIGVPEIRDFLRGKLSILQCTTKIRQNTRNYAKRQLTWFRNQTNFEPLNLSPFSQGEAVKWIARRAHRAFAKQG